VAYVLDTSAVLAVLLAEPGREPLVKLLEEESAGAARGILMPFMTLMEMQYRLMRSVPAGDALTAVRLVEAWPVEIVESSPLWRQRAAEVKSRGGLSLGDAWIASLALHRDAILVHRDREYDHVEGLRALYLRTRK
jgi:predicted nucleic acid-binding protein